MATQTNAIEQPLIRSPEELKGYLERLETDGYAMEKLDQFKKTTEAKQELVQRLHAMNPELNGEVDQLIEDLALYKQEAEAKKEWSVWTYVKSIPGRVWGTIKRHPYLSAGILAALLAGGAAWLYWNKIAFLLGELGIGGAAAAEGAAAEAATTAEGAAIEAAEAAEAAATEGGLAVPAEEAAAVAEESSSWLPKQVDLPPDYLESDAVRDLYIGTPESPTVVLGEGSAIVNGQYVPLTEEGIGQAFADQGVDLTSESFKGVHFGEMPHTPAESEGVFKSIMEKMGVEVGNPGALDRTLGDPTRLAPPNLPEMPGT